MTNNDVEGPYRLERVATGVPGLDTVLHGGLLERGAYIIQGGPGAGKTILANQICYHWAAQGRRALYVTLLAETHHRLLRHMRTMSFVNEDRIGRDVYYESCFSTLRSDGLKGVLRFMTRNVRQMEASLLVIDGLFVLEETATSEREFREFVNDLSGYADIAGVTILLLTNSKPARSSAEFTMVDGWIELDAIEAGLRTFRYLRVNKFRGSDFVSGQHMTRITQDGLTIYPRLEAMMADAVPGNAPAEGRLTVGVEALDGMLSGGIPAASTTLVLGPTGVGKTRLGLHYVCGSSNDEPGLILTFSEPPERLLRSARAWETNLGNAVDDGTIEIMTASPAEDLVDSVVEHLLDAVRRRNVKRLLIDGVDGLKAQFIHPERLSRFLAALTGRLRSTGVTTMLTMEIPHLFGGETTLELAAISAVAENIVLLRYAEDQHELSRTFAIVKMRESAFDPKVYAFNIGANGIVVSGRSRTAGPPSEVA